MAVRYEKIGPSVIVKVERNSAPAEERNRRVHEAGARGLVGKISVTVIYIEGVVVVGERCDVEIHSAVVIKIADSDSHRSLLAAIFAQRKTRKIAHIFERAIVAVSVEGVWGRIVGGQEGHPPTNLHVHACGRPNKEKRSNGDTRPFSCV